MQQHVYHKPHDMLKKAQKKQCAVLFWTDGMQKLQWNKTRSHCRTIPTLRQERKDAGTRTHGKLSLYAEGANGPLDQRSDFEDAQETFEILYHEHTAITGCGNTPIPPQQQVRQRSNQQFEGHEEHSCRLDSSGWKFYVPPQCIRLHLRHHDGNRATGGQHGTGTLHHGVHSDFLNVPDETFRLPGI